MKRPLWIARQSGDPSGPLGRLIGWIMAHETADENARTLALLDIQPGDRVLEIGFGHGRTIARAALLAHRGHVAGVDVSAQMVKMASAHNRRALQTGRVALQRTDGSRFPYPSASFDRAYSVHTVYFWSDAAAQLREIRRVLAPAGRLVLTFRYGENVVASLPAPIYVHRSPDEVAALLREAGWCNVAMHGDSSLRLAIAEAPV